ncbi:MAG: acyl-CoA dehydrogenase family protein [Fimbriimonadaceae bacterium]|nr:acyl-CoA dehydrogenase family protein [Fimbriimonadaceae bacterium]QYK54932.1 MAG: acyl-CoA dehydrogenase family protein [Fimbriimonadaceae bacterium]
MDFALTPEHDLIRESAYKFGQNVYLPGLAERDRAHASDPGVLKKMGEAGLLGVSIPQEYGGMGADYIALGIVCEELERADSTARVVMSVHAGLHSMTLLQWGTEEQKRRWLPKLATGEAIAGFGLTEPGAGSDAANLKTTARRDGDHYVLNGQKAWISLSDYADQFLVVARLVPPADKASTTGDTSDTRPSYAAFIIERTLPGFSSRPIKGKLGVRAGNTGELFFEDVRVPADCLIGEEGDGFRVAMSAIDHGRYTVAAGAVGLIQACLDASVKYANERMVGGEPIGKKQLVQQMIASMVQGREIGRLLYQKVGWMKNVGLRHTRECSMAKWTNCAAAFDAANKAVEIHGAYGYCDEFPVERYFRNSRGAMIYEGTHEIHTLMQAEYELGYRTDKPLKHTLPKWDARELGG